MESIPRVVKEDDRMDLPPGFRFHPSDEELISHYLYKKVMDVSFSARAIGEVDLNKSEPWDLPWKAKMGEKEWYFFCVRDRKYPTGSRTNRATESGYWKATGKDKEIYRGKSLVGMKKTLVFYKGRAPKGEKSNWVMHEYRLDGIYSAHNLPKIAKNEWVICRVFQKSSAGKKLPIPGLVRLGSFGNELGPNGLPPLMDSSPLNGKNKSIAESAYVPCFSNLIDVQKLQGNTNDSFNNPMFSVSSNLPNTSLPRMQFYSPQPSQVSGNMQYSGSVFMPDESVLKALLENPNWNMKQCLKTERELISASQETAQTNDINIDISSSVMSNLDIARRSYENQEAPSTTVGTQDIECFWTY